MATKTLLKNAASLLKIIQVEGDIHKFDLMDKASMSLSTFEKILPYLKHRFGQYFDYDSKTGMIKKKIVLEVSEAQKEITLDA